MIADIYPSLTNIERELDTIWPLGNNPLWGKGELARNAQINATISKFDRQIQTSSPDDLTVYAEGLKPHLKRAMEYMAGCIWTEYQCVLAECHKHLSFAFFAVILREYDNKKTPFIASSYAASAGIDDFTSFSSEVCQAADNWGIFHSPTIAKLLSESSNREKQKKLYNLLADYPGVKVYLDRVTPEWLNADYSLQKGTSKIDGAVIAYTICFELKITEVCEYFEHLWNVTGLKGSKQQIRARTSPSAMNKTKRILQALLRKPGPGKKEDIVDQTKVNKYLVYFSKEK